MSKQPQPRLSPSELYQNGKPAAERPVRPRSLKGHPDIRSTKEYKLAARRWTSIMVGLPIIMYTSWVLYERVYGNKSAKQISRPTLQPSSQSSQSS